jgi:hypothetical protein
VRYYRYQSEQDFDRLRGVVCDFARRVPDAPGKMNWSIEAVNWRGETRFSWRCADKANAR